MFPASWMGPGEVRDAYPERILPLSNPLVRGTCPGATFQRIAIFSRGLIMAFQQGFPA